MSNSTAFVIVLVSFFFLLFFGVYFEIYVESNEKIEMAKIAAAKEVKK